MSGYSVSKIYVVRDGNGRGIGEYQSVGGGKWNARRFSDPFVRKTFKSESAAKEWVVAKAKPKGKRK